ncbi:uncharacterized protein BO80DRAFT_393636 [Aspergillus ibericus CBS 121593]|uniref:Uncharacterized protein n=1 Tax=Aspergillus ibericus CBS 121593 TaxID=1448316 RepID=A0A395GJF5_9EURO|nr:hypothetical protein BO80DRAFT_393636 [Aspergillus ibericus CBS 121593]RAK95589.1 hypothetical protein BO80DRAFT_393636 [Aspergillus ibericus CBS 121593]
MEFRLGDNTAMLSVLLLTSSSLESSTTPNTISRLRQFFLCPASRASKKAIVFLLSEAPFSSASGRYRLEGLVALQVLMVESLPAMLPIIPIAESACLLSSMQEYITNLEAIDIPRRPFQSSAAFAGCSSYP